MISNLFNILAAQSKKEWLDILIPLAIAIIYAIIASLKKRSEPQQQGSAPEKPRYRPLDESQPPKPSYQNPQAAQNEDAPRQQPAQHEYDQTRVLALRQRAQREYDEAKELARRQYSGRMERIQEYENNKPPDVPDAVWQKQIENARKTVEQEYQNAQEQARQEYRRLTGQLPAAQPPVRKPQRQRPVPVQPAKSPEPRPVAAQTQAASTSAHQPSHHAEPAKVLAYHLSFAKDELTRGILYSEILGKPLALRDEA